VVITEKKRLEYHHWDDSRPSMGIWMCYQCHRLAERIDDIDGGNVDRLIEAYRNMKQEITTSFPTRPLF
jgi:hypothetical protein